MSKALAVLEFTPDWTRYSQDVRECPELKDLEIKGPTWVLSQGNMGVYTLLVTPTGRDRLGVWTVRLDCWNDRDPRDSFRTLVNLPVIDQREGVK